MRYCLECGPPYWHSCWSHMTWLADYIDAISSVPDLRFINAVYPIKYAHRFMMTSSNGNIFCVTGPLCGEFSGQWWIPLTKASDANFDVFFHLCLNKRLSEQWLGWWFETPSRSLWCHGNVCFAFFCCGDIIVPGDSYDSFTHVHLCYVTGTWAIVWFPLRQWREA